ncbi:MAG: HEPN domain-containing protein [Bacteroidota bacterium]
MTLDDKKLLTEHWVRIANMDFEACRRLLESDSSILWEPVLFHVQQAVEKWLTALCIWNEADFDFSHSIKYLTDTLVPYYPDLSSEENYKTAHMLAYYEEDSIFGFVSNEQVAKDINKALQVLNYFSAFTKEKLGAGVWTDKYTKLKSSEVPATAELVFVKH